MYVLGTLDCAALTPILKSEYPELLTSDPYLLQAGSDDSFLMEARMTSKDDLHSEPGSLAFFFTSILLLFQLIMTKKIFFNIFYTLGFFKNSFCKFFLSSRISLEF